MATPRIIAWLPTNLPAWAFMWLLAGAIFVGCKCLTWLAASRSETSVGRNLGYLFLWPGLDAPAFLHVPYSHVVPFWDWWFALAKTSLGFGLIFGIYPSIDPAWVLFRGWIGMVGILFVLHFGFFHLLSLAWRTRGVSALPLMNWPIRATSVSDFWGRRWNTAFRDLTYRFSFRPLSRRWGAAFALFVVYLFSGLIHDLVISLPARGGYGGPTLFFLIQALALFVERSSFGKRLGLQVGLRGWGFTLLVLVVPLPLLFHQPFVRDVIVPFVDAIVSLGRSTNV